VAAPGGYEWWYLDAEDRQSDLRIVGILFEGFVFHPQYLRAYWRYRRRPTRVAPPVPGDYCCAYLAVYRGGKLAAQFMSQYPRQRFSARADTLDVAVGPNRLWIEGGALRLSLRGTPWHLTATGPKRNPGEKLAADLVFEPTLAAPPLERRFFSRRLSGADHHWIIANPLCRARGTIEIGGQTISLDGLGYHDHNFGTGPIGPGLKRWFWGRVLRDDRVLSFHFARGREAEVGDEIIVIHGQAGEPTLSQIDVPLSRIRFSRRTALGLGYPTAASLGVAAPGDVVQLSHGRVIDSQPFYLRLVYDAVLDGDASHPATAFCEVAYPHRLRWPVLGRMIEMSIERHGPQS
jgi:carotenoid 1,2-hydratase